MPKKPNRPLYCVRKPPPQLMREEDGGFHQNYPMHNDSERMEKKGFRRVTFNSISKPKRKPKFLGVDRINDEDVNMTGSSTGPYDHGRNFNFRGRGGGGNFSRGGRFSPQPNLRGNQNPKYARPYIRNNSDYSWHKVIILQGNKYSKEFIIGQLQKFIEPDSFVPIAYKIVMNDAEFYVDNAEHARKIYSCNRKILMPDSQKLMVRTKPEYPQTPIDDVLRDKLKLALSKRYLSESNALDLTRFHHDPDLAEHYFCALFKPALMTALLEIVAECIPHLSALSLDSNRLGNLERLSILKQKFKNLKILHLSDNKLQSFAQFDYLQDLELEELKIDNNPLTAKYKNRRSDYISEVRRRFPKLQRLDNEELPKVISFDVSSDTPKFPETQMLFSANEEAKKVATQFLSEYFRVFDSGDRQSLFNAYHSEARFSLTATYYANNNSNYSSENRNLCRVVDAQKRRKLLKTHRLAVVSCLAELPPTQHLLHTLTMDICLATDKMMFAVTTGIFKELDGGNQHRYFNRTFMIVPEGNGFCICNEQMHISQPTDAQEKALKSESIAVPGTSMASSSQENAHKEQMALTLSQATNMNLEWSVKCLEECQWNYEKALTVFQECRANGQIPLEAFNK